jgi:type II restriction enzyme
LKLGFEDSPQAAFDSGTQRARVLTESWAGTQAYCPNCGHAQLSKFPNNKPVADLYCKNCYEEFELKSQQSKSGARVLDGAYSTKCERLAAQNNPNLMLLNYTINSGVRNLFIIPKHLFILDIIEKRKPLTEGARRAVQYPFVARSRSG